MRIVTAVTTVGLVSVLGVTGAHMADAGGYFSNGPSSSTGTSTGSAEPVAATPSPSGLTLPAGGVLEHRVVTFCGRVPKLIERADTAASRINGSAGALGSLARLKARQAKATANQHPKAADRLGKRIDRRTKRLANLPGVKTRLAQAKAECATLDLPTASGSPSASSSAAG